MSERSRLKIWIIRSGFEKLQEFEYDPTFDYAGWISEQLKIMRNTINDSRATAHITATYYSALGREHYFPINETEISYTNNHILGCALLCEEKFRRKGKVPEVVLHPFGVSDLIGVKVVCHRCGAEDMAFIKLGDYEGCCSCSFCGGKTPLNYNDDIISDLILGVIGEGSE